MAADLSRVRPVLVWSTDLVKMAEVVRELEDFPPIGVRRTGMVTNVTYGVFALHLTEAVWPELKAVLDRVSWTQVHITPMPPPPEGNRG